MKKLVSLPMMILFVAASSLPANSADADPRTNSWFTTCSSKYARIYSNSISQASGNAATTWGTNTTFQALPVYCGVQEIYSSSNWVYIRSSGLGSHVMGPWFLNAQHTQSFPNFPTNQHVLYRIPRNPTAPNTKSVNNGGPIGYFVDGVAMFNSWDAYYWNGSADTQSTGSTGYWNRDAYVNEGASFDANNAHQAGGQHHYHANPPALRYELGDHVNYNSTSKTYPEATNTPTKHSAILAWVGDGYPLYGPYGYSDATNANSGIRRMVSGYVLRNGQDGSENLTSMGRSYLPQWAVRLYGVASNVISGPSVSGQYPLGRYMEDNDYLGDLINPGTGTNYQQGVDFDLDQYNGRWCVTPEFPNGTYAYFVSITNDGTPVFPYNIGRGFYGNPTAGAVSSITEAVVTNFVGGPSSVPSLNAPISKSGAVTLSWSATEGGTYLVESTTNLTKWTTNTTAVTAVLNAASYTNNPNVQYGFYRVAQIALASYDTAGTGGYGGSGIQTVAPGGYGDAGNNGDGDHHPALHTAQSAHHRSHHQRGAGRFDFRNRHLLSGVWNGDGDVCHSCKCPNRKSEHRGDVPNARACHLIRSAI